MLYFFIDTVYTSAYGGTSQNSACVFPFRYGGQVFYYCTTLYNNFIPWCATTTNYDADKKWGNCVCK